MEIIEKLVDGFRLLPPSLGAWFAKDIPAQPFSGDIPWAPLKRPISSFFYTVLVAAN
jgi:hypothetical protein